MSKRVFVGMSGGVDSSVSAALLKKAGYDVTGVFIKVWQPDWLECTWKEDRRDAMRVAAHLGIPFLTLDLEKEYKKDVVDYMISEYQAGLTPNPDVMCNKSVKFGAFYDWAMNQGADFVATGHYAQIKKSASGLQMTVSVDANKDQTYFLWTIRAEQLPHILFPIGHLEKQDVRKAAHTFGLPTAEKKDSQGLCFIGKVDMKEFLSHYIETKEGEVVNENGEVIGRHPGALLFTIGERHGFTITKKTPHDAAYYVVSKDIIANRLIVSEKDADSSSEIPMGTRMVRLIKTNWLSGIPKRGAALSARSRYRQKLELGTLTEITPDGASFEFEKAQHTLAAGQSLVIYDGEICLGGGIIGLDK